jgi:membrane protease YdiL (CAAX protease family)
MIHLRPAAYDHGDSTRGGWPVFALIGTLVASNVMANGVLPDWAYVPWNLAATVVVILIALRWDRCTLAHLGLTKEEAKSGLVWGGSLALVIVVGMTLFAVMPWSSQAYEDSRAEVSGWVVAYRALIAIPLGTVLFEEVSFRGVLPALVDHHRSHRFAVLVSAGLFGLWHVLPSLTLSESNDALSDELPGVLGQLVGIGGGVIFTAFVGLMFMWLRDRSGSVLAPALVHIATNSTGFVLAWFIQS